VAEVAEHAPKAAILACSDARVPPSVVFDQPAGSLFVIRIAGNTATPEALASLDYAVEQLGVALVIVLGHSGCGAVQAAAAGTCGGHLAPIVEPICAIARANPDASLDRLVVLNVEETMSSLIRHDGPAGVGARTGTIEVRGAVHDLSTGSLVPLTDSPDPTTTRTLLETT
jgi:carbonic anhydrase